MKVNKINNQKLQFDDYLCIFRKQSILFFYCIHIYKCISCYSLLSHRLLALVKLFNDYMYLFLRLMIDGQNFKPLIFASHEF